MLTIKLNSKYIIIYRFTIIDIDLTIKNISLIATNAIIVLVTIAADD